MIGNAASQEDRRVAYKTAVSPRAFASSEGAALDIEAEPILVVGT